VGNASVAFTKAAVVLVGRYMCASSELLAAVFTDGAALVGAQWFSCSVHWRPTTLPVGFDVGVPAARRSAVGFRFQARRPSGSCL
jgi:hypothetical protein